MSAISEARRGTALLAIVVLIAATIRRFWKKASRGLSLVAAGYADAVEMRRAAQRKRRFAGE